MVIKTLSFLPFFCDICLPYVKFYSSLVDYILSIHEGMEMRKTNVFILESENGNPDHVVLWQQWNVFIGQIQDIWPCKINIEYLNNK